jgi:hypothetical protein
LPLAGPSTLASTAGPSSAASTAAAARPARRAPRALGAGLDHRQRNPFSLLVDPHDPGRDHVADTDYVVGALDVAVGKLADVDQTGILQADVYERAEVHDIQHGPLQLHARLQVFELEDALLEDGLGKVVSGVALGPGEGFEDVAEGRLADLQLFGKRGEVGLVELGVKLGEPLTLADDRGVEF